MSLICSLRLGAVAIVRRDGSIVECNQPFHDLVLGPRALLTGESVLPVLGLPSDFCSIVDGETGTKECVLPERGLRAHVASAFGVGGYQLLEVQQLPQTQEEQLKKKGNKEGSQVPTAQDANALMTHEVRNYMAAAQAGATFLSEYLEESGSASETPEGQQALEDASMVIQSLESACELLSSHLDLCRMLHGSLCFRLGPVDIAEDVVDPVAGMLRRRCKSGVSLSVDCAANTRGLSDKVRIKQVMMNLVGNACKFTDQGFVRVIAKCANEQLQVRVEDSGMGVSTAAAASLFARFAPVGCRETGTGIGLHLSRLIVEKLGGRMWLDQSYVSGVEGCPGSAFCFSLPLRKVEEEEISSSSSSSSSVCSASDSGYESKE